MASESCLPGSEASEARLFSVAKISPWDEVAYPEANMSLLQAYSDLEAGVFEKSSR